ncbi:MAG: hypothetical protein GX594_11085 [Pirellulaceae bacterium]|nr:hypothetical protein [Pirellulaceae bacterium]
MVDAKELCSEWQSLLEHFRPVFTLGGWTRFAQWITGTVLCSEEHTITQILTGLGLEDQWRNVEHFAEYGSWDREAIERQLMRLVEQEHPTRWGRYHAVAIDDTKEHRTSADVWGTCTFHESGARSPNRATTVRAHNWVVMGDLAPGKPWTYMPTASPQNHAQWDVPWQRGRAYIYGKIRTFRYKCLRCCWAVGGPEQIMFAFVFEVPGYDKLWATITSASDLSASQTLSANAGRFRQEDGFRDHKQRLGMEECRAWTKEPVLRTFQVQMTALTLLRLMQFRLSRQFGEAWCPTPPWNLRKRHVSILDLRRLFWKHRSRFSQVMSAVDNLKKPPQTQYHSGQPTSRAA